MRCSPAQANLNDIAYVDTIDVCNLKCPTCIRGLRGMPNSAKKMPLEQFQRIVQKLSNEGYKRIGLFNWTEPFINPSLHEYVTIVKTHGLFCIVSTNFSLRRIPGLEAALRSGIDHLIISVSGFDQEIYEINHVDGNISYVKNNLRRAATFKESGITSARIVLRFIKFPYNEDQERKLETFSKELGVEFEIITGVGDPTAHPVITTNHDYEEVLRLYRSERPYDRAGKVCPLMFGQTPIDSNGKVYLCCAYPSYESLEVGSYLDLPQEEILFRRYSHPMCGSCDLPRRDATPDDNQALVEALHYRLGIMSEQPDTPAPAQLPVEFDANRYLAINKDVADAGVDPVLHYLTQGYKEGRRLI
jgi:MoaA/NifB/PqqE/SkfB family radical SAM enzyme